ncbi:MAG TPA: translation factor GTPase family protein [Lapillicoccus sp.]|nr:translation factor GTPase family protein [Lapillicoccus sp.]
MLSPEPTLNLGILAHVDAGKTSLTERLLYEAGVVRDLGSVDGGDTQTDTMALERRRGITIRSAVASFAVDGLAVNLVDTPGHSDFVAEVERALAVLDGCVLVVSAVEGVQAQTLVLFRALRRLRIPTVFFVNKIDRRNADPDRVVAEIRERLTPDTVCVGAVTYPGSPAAGVRRDAVDRLTEDLAGLDDEVLAAAVGERPAYPRAELTARLGALTAAGRAHPVLFGSAITGAGVRELMDLLPVLLPPPPADPDGPACGVVFTIRRGDDGEKLVHVRLRAGTLHVRDRIDLGHGREERVTAVRVYRPGRPETSTSLRAGQIGVVRGLESARIGDPIGAWTHPEADQFVRPSLETVVDPVDPADRVALYAALGRLAEQDPLIDVRQDDGRREVSVSLYGEVQKEVLGSLLEADYGVPVTFRESTPICVERLVGSGADAELIATPSNPFLATVGLRVEPAPLGSGVSVGLEVELGSMPSAFFAAVEESVRTTLRQGPHGWEIPDCTVTITHSGYWGRHSIGHADFTKSLSSTAADYRCLAPLVLMTALQRARTVVCVPVHRFELEIPERLYAPVLAALPRLSATPLETVQSRSHLVVRGTVPAVAVHALQQRVPDLTSGEGLLTTRLDHFDPAVGPPPTRPRTDDDPTDRVNYLKTTTRRVGRS